MSVFSGHEHPDELSERLAEVLDAAYTDRVAVVSAVAAQAHEGQRRAGDQPYIVHPLRVAISAVEAYRQGLDDLDVESLAVVGLAHDVLEDAPEWTARLSAVLAARERELVVLLSKSVEGVKVDASAYWDRISAHLVSRALKLEDRIDNLRFLHHSNRLSWRERYLAESEKLVLPLADDLERRQTLLDLIAEQRGRLRSVGN